MEFHIAHEKIMNERKKYLIPLMLENLNPNHIQDVDLRMYVESHTYLDCKDQVSKFLCLQCVTVNWLFLSCSELFTHHFRRI